jgi:hypothetical protein
LGNWYHLALTYDSVNGLTGYVNGAVDGTHAANGLLATAGLTLRFGGGDAGGNSFSGRIAQVAEWNVVLTPTEIMALSNGTLPSQVRQTALAGYWPLDGIESPEPDFSGNANNGTVTGTGKAAGAPMMMFTPRRPLTVPFDATIILPFANTQQLMFM